MSLQLMQLPGHCRIFHDVRYWVLFGLPLVFHDKPLSTLQSYMIEATVYFPVFMM